MLGGGRPELPAGNHPPDKKYVGWRPRAARPRMDFLVLFSFYLALLLIGGVVLCVCLQTSYLKGLARGGAQIFSYIIPEWLQRAVLRLLHYLFHTRNNAFIILHLVLQGLVYTEYSWEVLGYCQELDFSLCYLLLPHLLLAANLVFFTLSCVTDPERKEEEERGRNISDEKDSLIDCLLHIPPLRIEHTTWANALDRN